MQDYARLEYRLIEGLELERRPIAIAFRDMPPPGVPAFAGTQPSGCSFWRLAAGGQAFYTVPEDHYNCAIGATRTTCRCHRSASRNSIRHWG
jgi:hypothetical protein